MTPAGAGHQGTKATNATGLPNDRDEAAAGATPQRQRWVLGVAACSFLVRDTG
jgi:hypothetical protein